jgi:hypothetical protein
MFFSQNLNSNQSAIFLIALLFSVTSIRAQDAQMKFVEATILTKQDSIIKCLVGKTYYYYETVPYKLIKDAVVAQMPVKSIKSITLPYQYIGSITLDGKEYLMERVVNGKVKLYKYSEQYITTDPNIGRSGRIYKSIEYLYDNTIFCLVKDGINIEITKETKKKILRALFHDCNDLSDSIGTEYYTFYNFESLVKAYNDYIEKNGTHNEPDYKDSVYFQADEMPQYKGGDSAYSALLEENFEFIRFPHGVDKITRPDDLTWAVDYTKPGSNPSVKTAVNESSRSTIETWDKDAETAIKEFSVEYELLIGKDNTVIVRKKLNGDIYNEDNLKTIITKNSYAWIPATEESKAVSAIINLKIHVRDDKIFAHIYSPYSQNTDYQKGKLKDGYKTGIWEYYDEPGNLSLKINYDNSSLLFLEKDTSEFMIKENGNWTLSKLDVQPRYIGSIREFYKLFQQIFVYPEESIKNKINGRAFLEFEIDTTGHVANLRLLSRLDRSIDDEIIKVFKQIPDLWLTAYKGHQTFISRFRLPIDFKIIIDSVEQAYKEKTKIFPEDLKPAKELNPVAIILKGKKMVYGDVMYYEEK